MVLDSTKSTARMILTGIVRLEFQFLFLFTYITVEITTRLKLFMLGGLQYLDPVQKTIIILNSNYNFSDLQIFTVNNKVLNKIL